MERPCYARKGKCDFDQALRDAIHRRDFDHECSDLPLPPSPATVAISQTRSWAALALVLVRRARSVARWAWLTSSARATRAVRGRPAEIFIFVLTGCIAVPRISCQWMQNAAPAQPVYQREYQGPSTSSRNRQSSVRRHRRRPEMSTRQGESG